MCSKKKPCKGCVTCENCKDGKPCVITKDCKKCMKRKESCNTCVECKECEGNLCNRDDFNAIERRLRKGNRRFRKNNLQYPNIDRKRRKCTAINGQKPFAIVLSCADSRVPPELIFDTGIGDLFVVRVAGNIANTSSIASIEFAVAALGCQYILVLGHEGCGAVKAAMSKDPAPSDNLSQLVGHILPAVNACKCSCKAENNDYYTVSEKEKDSLEMVTKENVLHSANELTRCSEIIRKAVNSSKVKIQTAYYNLESGKVNFDIESGC